MKRILIYLVKIYQWTPLKSHDLCRHHPKCSDYMIEALEVHGSVKGLYLGIKRISKCRPFGTYGYDPVPRKEELK